MFKLFHPLTFFVFHQRQKFLCSHSSQITVVVVAIVYVASISIVHKHLVSCNSLKVRLYLDDRWAHKLDQPWPNLLFWIWNTHLIIICWLLDTSSFVSLAKIVAWITRKILPWFWTTIYYFSPYLAKQRF